MILLLDEVSPRSSRPRSRTRRLSRRSTSSRRRRSGRSSGSRPTSAAPRARPRRACSRRNGCSPGSAAVGGQSGSPDPVQAVEDALESFPADEVVVVGRGSLDEELLTGLRRFGVPVPLERAHAAEPTSRRSRLRSRRCARSARGAARDAVGRLRRREPRAPPDRVVIAAIASLIVWLRGPDGLRSQARRGWQRR